MTDIRYDEAFVLGRARDAYEQGTADLPLRAEDAALLVIAMQDEFVRPEWTPYWVPAATAQVPRIREIIRFSRAAGIPVIFTVFAQTHQRLDRPKSGAAMPNRYSDVASDPEWFTAGSVWHELEPEDGEVVIRKPSYGAFYDTPLETILRNLARETSSSPARSPTSAAG